MIKNLLSLLFLFAAFIGSSQSVQITAKINSESIELKWYSPTLIPTESVNIFRSTDSINWKKINTSPIRKFEYSFTADDILKDNELNDFKFILKNNANIEDLSKLIFTLKSFKSIPFSKFLGIYYKDSESKPYGNYFYKIENESEKILGVSNVFSFEINPVLHKIDSIYYEQKRKGVSFGWIPEPLKYYGVNIYRSTSADSLGTLINKDPILVSKVKSKEGKSEYPKFFLSDELLPEKNTYFYTLVGVDFFNENTAFSDPIKIRIKDETRPIAPTDLRKQVYDKKVYLYWNKEDQEDDFLEYQLYYTTPKDSVPKKIETTKPLSFKDSTHAINELEIGLYFIKVAAADEDGNLAYSNEVVVEILDIIPPQIPQDVIVISDSARLIVQWTANIEGDLRGYKIYRSIEGSFDNLALLTAYSFSDNFFIDSLPKNAMNKFSYAVLAIDTNFNESALSPMASNAMFDITPPREPFIKTIHIEDLKIKIDWVKNVEVDLNGYNLYRKKFSDTLQQYELVNQNLIPSDISAYFDRTYEMGSEYVYYIVALDKVGNKSKPSNEFKVFIPKEKKIRLISVRFTRTKYLKKVNSLRLRWKYEQDFEEDEIAQKVLLKKNTNGDFKVLSYISNESKYTDSELVRGENVEYQVRVYDKEGNIYRSEIYIFNTPLKK